MAPIETSSPDRSFRQPGVRAFAAVLVVGLLLVVSRPALAMPEFPGIIVEHLDQTAAPPEKPAIDCTPTCTLCHTSPNPDSGNAGQPIANSLLSFPRTPGLPEFITPENLPVFLQALEIQPCPTTMDGLPCDADGDGEADIFELRRDSDPNGSGILACPKYGCGARIAPERSSRPLDGTMALAALSAAAVFVRRFRRR